MKCYALLAPHLNGGGAGNSARSVQVAGRRVLLAWKGRTSLAMGCDCGFTRSQLRVRRRERRLPGPDDRHDHGLVLWPGAEWQYRGDGGDRRAARHPRVHRAIALGDGHHAALQVMQTLSTPMRSIASGSSSSGMRAKTPDGSPPLNGRRQAHAHQPQRDPGA